jgi:hypothetical protein
MIPLDCETLDSALHSCAALLRMGPADLLERLQTFEYDKLPAWERRNYPYESLLQMHALRITPGPDSLPAPPVIYWFHATRTTPDATFQEGILPLKPMLPRIWDFLGQLASEWSSRSEWLHFRENMDGPGAQQYAWKVCSAEDQGPFGFLVRSVILCSEDFGNHDYLGIPEIVEDICLSYEEMFDQPLRESYLRATQPRSALTLAKRWPAPVAGPDSLVGCMRGVGGDLRQPRASNAPTFMH